MSRQSSISSFSHRVALMTTLVFVAALLAVPISAQNNSNLSLSKCPFSRWNGDPRYCYECRWCPFRQSTCCEMEDEISVLKSVNVSGSDYWDCFITIVHFQQCGMCSPSARSYVQNVGINYVWNANNLSIRPCKQSCQYIYKQCQGALTLNGDPVIPRDMDSNVFCSQYPESSTPDLPCYDSASSASLVTMALVVVATLLTLLFS